MSKNKENRLSQLQQVAVFGFVLGVISGIISGVMACLMILAFNQNDLTQLAKTALLIFLGSIIGGLLLSLSVWLGLLLLSRQAPEFFFWPTEAITNIFSKPKKEGQ